MKVKYRVKSNIEFGNLVKQGKCIKNTSFIIHFKENTLNLVRVGISVSSKLGHAVRRNRIKRQIRSMCDSLIDYDNGSIDIVIIARSAFLGNDFQTNLSSLKQLLNQMEEVK